MPGVLEYLWLCTPANPDPPSPIIPAFFIPRATCSVSCGVWNNSYAYVSKVPADIRHPYMCRVMKACCDLVGANCTHGKLPTSCAKHLDPWGTWKAQRVRPHDRLSAGGKRYISAVVASLSLRTISRETG
ncbi:unnamed protein product [Ectocarpus sp. 12 AP-2014]